MVRKRMVDLSYRRVGQKCGLPLGPESVSGRFDTSRFDTSRSQFVSRVKSIQTMQTFDVTVCCDYLGFVFRHSIENCPIISCLDHVSTLTLTAAL